MLSLDPTEVMGYIRIFTTVLSVINAVYILGGIGNNSLLYIFGNIILNFVLVFANIIIANWVFVGIWSILLFFNMIQLFRAGNQLTESESPSADAESSTAIPEPTPTPVRPRRRRETIAVEIVDQNAAAVKKLCPYCGAKPEKRTQKKCLKCGEDINPSEE